MAQNIQRVNLLPQKAAYPPGIAKYSTNTAVEEAHVGCCWASCCTVHVQNRASELPIRL